MVTVNIENDEIVDLFYQICKDDKDVLDDFFDNHTKEVKAYAKDKLNMRELE